MTNRKGNAVSKINAARRRSQQHGESGSTKVSFDELIALAAQARKLVCSPQHTRDALSFGVNDAVRRGQGMAFAESRRWVSGDDVRHIDWRVTARTGETHTKVFDTERDQTFMLVIDMRSSLAFGTRIRFKSVQAARAAMLLAWSATFIGNRVGAAILKDDGLQLHPCQRGYRTVAQLAARLSAVASALTSRGAIVHPAANALDAVLRHTPAGAKIFVVSDLLGWSTHLLPSLERLAQRFPVLAVRIIDAVERDAPPPGTYVVRQAEKRHAIAIRDPADRQRWRERIAALSLPCEQKLASLGIPVTTLATDDSASKVLANFLNNSRSVMS